jgi:hypothetical protein
MLGPNALTQQLLQSYLRYLFSAHPIGVHNPELEQSLRERLHEERTLVNGPILELDLASKGSATIDELIRQGTLCEKLRTLGTDGQVLGDRRLYTHQVGAIRKCAEGRSVVVASGTGSGKTEAWLYPVVSEMLANPTPGLRAIVLYPMNALADDQRRIRMRGLLTGTPVTYGEFTGNTPHDHSDPNGQIDQGAPLNEIQTRKALRETPPNILITNPSMLEYLLLRPEDNALFKNANLQFLILDEAHTYRGAYGIELGHLLRRLKARLGVASVRSFLLSATIDRDLDSIESFAGNLTGEAFGPDSIFFGEPEPPGRPSTTEHRPIESYSIFTPDVIGAILAGEIAIEDVPGIHAFGEDTVLRASAAENGGAALWELLQSDGHVIALRELLQSGPRPIADLAQRVFGPHQADIDSVVARLVDAAASAREVAGGLALLPARYHVFLRGLDGLRVCFNPEHGTIGVGSQAIGSYSLETRDVCECGYPLWELLICGDCAAWYLRDREGSARSADAEITGIEGAVHLINPDEDVDDESAPNSCCLLCRAPAGCDCPPFARRSIVPAKTRKTCLNCGSDNVMGVMTGTMAPTLILGEVLTGAQDKDPKFVGKGSGKKLLTFSDSRRGAAQFAAQFDRSHRQHIQRAAIYQALSAHPDPSGLEVLAVRVSKILLKHGFYSLSPNNVFKARALVFEEFTASYASRRRLEALGLGASRLLFEANPPASLCKLAGSEEDARALVQSFLEIIQYDTAVTRPEEMAPARGFAGLRGEVHFTFCIGPKRWTAPGAPQHQRRRNRQFNLAARLVGEVAADQLLKEVWEYAVCDGVLVGNGDRYQVSSDRLEFYLPSSWFRCSSCRRVTPYGLSDGRGCATRDCDGVLIESADVVQREDHFTRNVTESIEYLRVEEHTAQLEPGEGRRIGRDFRDGVVNVLSCSTTFELGVDIGSLQSVFMRNVPPSVANYRQRAGRAGRTRQGAAFLLTYCSPTPHDRVFFENPGDIITGELAVPVFNLANGLLMRRHLNSVLLSSLWRFTANRVGARNLVDDFLLADDVRDLTREWLDFEDLILDGELRRYETALSGMLRVGDSKRKVSACMRPRVARDYCATP